MAKLRVENIFLNHGEKLILGLGVGCGLLLSIVGFKDAIGSPGSAATIAELQRVSDRIQEEIDRGNRPPPLVDWLTKKIEIHSVDPSLFAMKDFLFEPTKQFDALRGRPKVLNVVDAQWDFIRFPMRGLDIQTEIVNGEFRVREWGIKIRSSHSDMPRTLPTEQFPKTQSKYRRTIPYGLMKDQKDQNVVSAKRDDVNVVYRKFEDIPANADFAEAVHPLRGVMIQAAFPMRDQLKEIWKALRTKSELEAMRGSAVEFTKNGRKIKIEGPVMAGYEVQRREIPIDVKFDPNREENNKDYEWQFLDHEFIYNAEIGCRRIDVEPVPDEFAPFVPKDQHRFWLPMPKVADDLGSYPKIRMKVILEAAAKHQRDNSDLPAQPEQTKQILPGGDAFDSGDARPKPNSPPIGAVPAPRVPQVNPDKDLPPDFVMLRFIDTSIKPGFKYYYRIRVKMMNPNFNAKADTVRLPKYATDRELFPDNWYEVNKNQAIILPVDSFLYASDRMTYMKNVRKMGKESDPRMKFDEVIAGSAAVVQFQTWVPKIALEGGFEEPVGSWIVAEMPASVGEYIGRRQLVELPLWNAAQSNYILRRVTGIKFYGEKEPKGWPINFRTDSILVNVDGGRIPADLKGDEPDYEILIVNADGKVSVRRSADDSVDLDRRTREAEWNGWLNRVKERKDPTEQESKADFRFNPRR